MKDQISEQEFAVIANKVLQENADVESFSVQDSSVTARIISRLRRENVDVYLDFDDGGKITGKFSYAQTKEDSAFPLILGNTIAECIKQFRSA